MIKDFKNLFAKAPEQSSDVDRFLEAVRQGGCVELTPGKSYALHIDFNIGRDQMSAIIEMVDLASERTGAKFVIVEREGLIPCA
ncbi:hypothetical protein [Methylophaga lonarensis]|uniref:hypothetical protein n=1 Tax=Methylophaga lonarensis TaxID=999151 RepID=UPI003D2AE6AB